MEITNQSGRRLGRRGELYLGRAYFPLSMGFPWVRGSIRQGYARVTISPERVIFHDEQSGRDFAVGLDAAGNMLFGDGTIAHYQGRPANINTRLGARVRYLPFWPIALGHVDRGLSGRQELEDWGVFRKEAFGFMSQAMVGQRFPFWIKMVLPEQTDFGLSIPLVEQAPAFFFAPELTKVKRLSVSLTIDGAFPDPRVSLYTAGSGGQLIRSLFYDREKNAFYTIDPMTDGYGVRTYYVRSDENRMIQLPGLPPLCFSPKTAPNWPWRIQVDGRGELRQVMYHSQKSFPQEFTYIRNAEGETLYIQVGKERAQLVPGASGEQGFRTSVCSHGNRSTLEIGLPGRRHFFLPEDCGLAKGEHVFVSTENGFPMHINSLDRPGKSLQMVVVRDEEGRVVASASCRVNAKVLTGRRTVEHVESFLKIINTRPYECVEVRRQVWSIRRLRDPAARPGLYTLEFEGGNLLSIKAEAGGKVQHLVTARDCLTGQLECSAKAKSRLAAQRSAFSLLEHVPVRQRDDIWQAFFGGEFHNLAVAPTQKPARQVALLVYREKNGAFRILQRFDRPELPKNGHWPAKKILARGLEGGPSEVLRLLVFLLIRLRRSTASNGEPNGLSQLARYVLARADELTSRSKDQLRMTRLLRLFREGISVKSRRRLPISEEFLESLGQVDEVLDL